MSQPVMQKSFNSGEWAPQLNARVDLQKYASGAALLNNFFVDYRGGASTRTGTKYILQCFKSATAVRLIPFQASFLVDYVMEFGDFYIRFFSQGSAILESGVNITGVNNTNPGTITAPMHGYHNGDWVFITGVAGITVVNNKYFIVGNAAVNTFDLFSLNGSPFPAFGPAYAGGGITQRVYTLSTPYSADELPLIKFAQNVNFMVLCHPNHVPYILTLVSANNWTLNPIVFGATVSPPATPAIVSTLPAGSVTYSYIVTTVDNSDQESGPSSPGTLGSLADIRTTAGTNSISWTAVPGAQFYNVYKAVLSFSGVPAGAAYGFIGFTNGTTFKDTNIAPDFSETPPISQNPFQGAGLQSITVTNPGTPYTTVPTVTLTAAPAGGQTATARAVLQVQGTPAVVSGGASYQVGDVVNTGFNGNISMVVAAIVGGGVISAFQPITFPGSNPGAVTTNPVPPNPLAITNPRGGTQGLVNVQWGVGQVELINKGAGYVAPPTVTFSSGGASASVVMEPAGFGNPTVPAFHNQRLFLGGPVGSPQTFYFSKPGLYFNFDVSNPAQPDDAITGTLVSNQLNTIKSALSMPTGLIVLTDRAAWLINGGQNGQPVSAIDISANSQAYNGASDVPPILVTFDILYVQSKNSVIRDLSFNLYANIYTGTDISVLSSHLFYGFNVTEWAFAEEPYKLLYAIRDDGVLLNLTFMKEQDLIAWTHSITQGQFKSVCSVVETLGGTIHIDAVYVVAQRTVSGGGTLKFIERFAERFLQGQAQNAWCVDSGLQYIGPPTTTFSGGEHLANLPCVGLADGFVMEPFNMSPDGTFTLVTAASRVTVGLAYTPQLTTLQLDVGEPTAQGKEKKISAVTVRVAETLNLKIGSTFDDLVNMKDLRRGQVGSATNTRVMDLVTGDAQTVIDPKWSVPGQYTILQPDPMPATILGVIPRVAVGDTK